MGKKNSKPQLALEELEFLKTNTKFSEKDIKRWFKVFMRNCPRGHLTREEFLKVYQDFFPSGAAEEFSDYAFRAFDSDNVGYVDFRKFLMAVNVTSNGTPQDKLEWVFRMYDIDGSGSIEEAELVKILEAIYQMLGAEAKKLSVVSPKERARMIFERMDTNHDLELTMQEFVDACIADKELCKILT